MKQLFFFIAIVMGLSATSFAQNKDDSKKEGNRIDALKIAYLTKKLQLSPEEAQKFWPIYNKYTDEVREVRMDQKKNKLPELEVEDKLLTIRKKYNSEFGKALSTEKINTFFKSEKEFAAFLQREMMERRQQRLDNRRQVN